MPQQPELVTDPRVLAYVDTIRALNGAWEPHDGQITAGRALFTRRLLSLFIQCGRKWGKTEFILYCLWRWCQLNPGSQTYYISPYFKQSKEIVWANQRVQSFGPRAWLRPGSSGINNTELRLTFNNRSFIKCDGSDNFEAYRGIQPHLVVMEESKDHRPQFWQAMEPNLAVHEAPVIWIGTPPDRDCEYTKMAEEHRRDPEKFFLQGSVWQNPHIRREYLHRKKKELYARGEGDVWEREWEGRFVKGGAAKVFPMVDRRIIRPHADLMRELEKDRKKLEWYWWADPAGATCHAVLFAALNPYTKRWYMLDEIYEKDQAKMSTRQIGRRALDIRDELWSRGEWRQGYDEAATWFYNEMYDHFEEALEPSQKGMHPKDAGLTLIKDILLADLMWMSDRCPWFYWELDNFFKDKKGKYPKENDHLMDDFRYILGAAHYSVKSEVEYREEHDPDFRGAKISDDFPHIGDAGFSQGGDDPW